MDLLTAERAIEGYRKAGLDAADLARLEFFQGIWEIWDEEERALAGAGKGEDAPVSKRSASAPYATPDPVDLKVWYTAGEPFIQHAPVCMDAGDIARVAVHIASYLADRAGFSESESRGLVAMDWEALARAAGAELAGSDPDAFLARAGELARGVAGESLAGGSSVGTVAEPGVDAADGAVTAAESAAVAADGAADGVGAAVPVVVPTSAAPLVPLVLSLALRPLLEPASRSCMDAVAPALTAAYDELPRPLSCPVCGCAPALGYVGPTPGNSGNGRELYCAQCGCVWEVERVRCARCGTRSQTKLRYLSLAGDELHRVHVCDECGGYLRTYFAGGLDSPLARGLAGAPSLALAAPFSPEVEDVVMAPLDAVAREAAGASEG